jgi:hypothetical protein
LIVAIRSVASPFGNIPVTYEGGYLTFHTDESNGQKPIVGIKFQNSQGHDVASFGIDSFGNGEINVADYNGNRSFQHHASANSTKGNETGFYQNTQLGGEITQLAIARNSVVVRSKSALSLLAVTGDKLLLNGKEYTNPS